MGKGGNLCIDNTFILLVPPGVDLYQNDERGVHCASRNQDVTLERELRLKRDLDELKRPRC